MGWPGWRSLWPAAVAGAFAALGQAPLGWWWAALPAFAAVVALVARAGRGAGWVAWVAGAGYFAAALNWIVEPFLVDAQAYGWMAPFAVVFLSFGLALFWAVAGAASGLFAQRGLGFALTLTLAELARGYVLTGFPWALPGHVWIGHAPAQVAALAGANGLTLFTLVAAALLAMRRPGPALAALALVGAGWGYGAWRLALPEPAARAGVVRLVQPNAEQSLKWDPVQADVFFRRLIGMTQAGARPDLTVWPETAVPYLLEDYPQVAVAIADAGRGAPVVSGIQRVEGWRFWNSLAVIGPDGAVGQVYDKHHLVPFGEYIPFGDLAFRWFGLRAFAAQQGNGYSAGEGPKVLDLGPLGKVLPIICYEAVFPQDLRAAPERADWILQITNDAWFGTLTGPWQHLAQAELRAIEQGLPLLRVANTGVTAVIDARGRVVQSLPMGEAASLDVTIPGQMAAPPYARFGEGPVLVLLAGLGAALRLAGRRKSA
nr:apolipoprotein N-acyltransferase [Gemmobacter straminiformis]